MSWTHTVMLSKPSTALLGTEEPGAMPNGREDEETVELSTTSVKAAHGGGGCDGCDVVNPGVVWASMVVKPSTAVDGFAAAVWG